MAKKKSLGLLPRVVAGIVLGIVCGLFFPQGLVRLFLTFNDLFGQF